MAVTSERKNRRNTYTATRRGTEAPIPRKGGGNRRKSDTKKSAKKKKKRLSLSLPRVSSQGLRRFLRWALGLSIVGFMLFGAVFGMIKAWRFCLTSEYFTIREIAVSGNVQVKTPEVLRICGIEKGENSLAVNVHKAEQELMKNPWIESVNIRRDLPDSFTIQIEERVPLFCARKNDRLYYVSGQGLLIAPVDPRSFRSLPVLELGPGGDEALPLVADFVELFRKAGFPFGFRQVSSLRLSAAKGFELYVENRRLRLTIGLEQWQDNLRRIASVVSDIDKRKETVMVSSIRAADGQVWMTKTQEEQKDETASSRIH
ncbi:cell division protein FtsQ/DivIB [Mailhella sp.]|uniref:cell division protein FtsQ/DivIB n=1 Tax=Mailhella sp. TaxID=1981029 RepID=UPI004063B03A